MLCTTMRRKSNRKTITKQASAVSLLIVLVIGLTVSGCKQSNKSGDTMPSTKISIYPNPTGTWTAGDRNSVYNRLVVRSAGSFSFETVDFTGDVKGGYSGTWRMNGKSIRFEWGRGGADSGSCSGRKTGRNSLIFGATTFHK